MRKGYIILSILLCFGVLQSAAQDHRTVVQNYLEENLERLGLEDGDIADWEISDAYETRHNGVTHIHIQQKWNGINVFNGVCNFTLDREGKVVHAGSLLVGMLAVKAGAASFAIDENAARNAAMSFKGLTENDILESTIRPVYYPSIDAVRLSWHLTLHTRNRQHVWNVIVDGMNGRILDSWDVVLHCSFTAPVSEVCASARHEVHRHDEPGSSGNSRLSSGTYNVFAVPVESPIHGPRTLLTDAEYTVASPFGWHDSNGQEGADFTITRGNNVFAFEDADNNGSPGYSPEGGPGLNFDFPFAFDVAPVDNQDAALTNLFYMNNVIHDVLYAYGFDEPSGNFQANNYGNGGSGGDAVRAQGFDGGGLNNATFFTPADGQNPTMQMFLWNSGGTQEYLTINSPSAIAGGYTTTGATFGPGIPSTPLTADVVLYVDAVAPVNDACDPAVNAAALNGKFALIDRIECTFVDKILRAQEAGAVGVIMVNNVIGAPITMGGASGAVTIPSVMITIGDGTLIKAQLNNGMAVNATIVDLSSGTNLLDGNFDNAIIAHEYGHGISNRLIGGRLNVNCMNNTEQMGEGWSDWYGIMLTMNMNASNPVYRPVGTYVIREDPENGFGIRPTAYDTSMAVNPYTFGNVGDNNISIPHGLGFIWCTMLWDMTWALIDEYGYDPDLYNGTGGNNIAMQLVTDGLKMTQCSPGFVNGRDAILLADQMNNNGANQCLIWKAFARRGLGFSASQGFSFNVNDGVEAFDLPPSCTEIDEELAAGFLPGQTVSCNGAVQFTDTSSGAPLSWTWDFGDGNTSDEQNPLHQYDEDGTYSVTLTITRGADVDSLIQTDLVTVLLLDAPSGDPLVRACKGEAVELTADAPNLAQWYDAGNNPVGTGASYTTEALNASTTYSVADIATVNEVLCESERLVITVELIEAGFNATTDGLTVSFEDASVNATSWSWDFGDGSGSSDQSPVHTYASPGMYDVTLIVDGQCPAEQTVNALSTGLDDLEAGAGLTLIPNPAHNSVTLRTALPLPEGALIELISVDGRRFHSQMLTVSTRETLIDLRDAAEGLYEVMIYVEGELMERRSLVVARP